MPLSLSFSWKTMKMEPAPRSRGEGQGQQSLQSLAHANLSENGAIKPFTARCSADGVCRCSVRHLLPVSSVSLTGQRDWKIINVKMFIRIMLIKGQPADLNICRNWSWRLESWTTKTLCEGMWNSGERGDAGGRGRQCSISWQETKSILEIYHFF